MSRSAYLARDIRAAEQPLLAALPAGALMQRAAGGLAAAVARYLGCCYGARIGVLAGSGDNGGDALFAGALLARRGARVAAVAAGGGLHAGGSEALRAAGGVVLTAEHEWAAEMSAADVVLDGIVGIGGRPGLRDQAVRLLAAVATAGVPVVAVDVPSGVSVDDGAVPADGGYVRAALTVTFGAYQPCHFIDPAAAACGAVHLVEIGLRLGEPAMTVLQAADVAGGFPRPGAQTDKYARGVLGIVAGSAQYPGAAVLACSGALAGGAGMVRYLGPEPVADAVRARHPEVVAAAGRVQAWTIGSGLGDEHVGEAVRAAFDSPEPMVVDADGLRQLAGPVAKPALLTPHAGELARLLGIERSAVEAERLAYARQAAERFAATVLLKGSTTVIVAPDGRVRVNTHGTPWLATAGTGDVLAGLCGALLAAGLDPLDAGALGAYLHSAAAELASAVVAPITASEVAAHLGSALSGCAETGK